MIYACGYADTIIMQQEVLDPEVVFLEKPIAAENLLKNLREVLGGRA